MPSGLILLKGKPLLHLLNPRKRIHPLPVLTAFLDGGWVGRGQGNFFSLRWETNGMKMRKGNENAITLLFSLKRLETLYQERRGQVKTIVMEHFNGILFYKFGPAKKQHTNNSITSVGHIARWYVSISTQCQIWEYVCVCMFYRGIMMIDGMRWVPILDWRYLSTIQIS